MFLKLFFLNPIICISYLLLLIERCYWWMCCCWLWELLVRFILLEFCIITSIVFIILVKLWLIQTVTIISADVIWIKIIPLVNWHDNKVSVTFIWYVNRNEWISKLLRIYWNGVWFLCRLMILGLFIGRIKNVDCVVTRARWLGQLVTVTSTNSKFRSKVYDFN